MAFWEEIRVDIGRLHEGVFEWSNDRPDEVILIMEDKRIKFVIPIVPLSSVYMETGRRRDNGIFGMTLDWNGDAIDVFPSLVGATVEVAIMNFDRGWVIFIITNEGDAYQSITTHPLGEYKMYEGTLGGYNVSLE